MVFEYMDFDLSGLFLNTKMVSIVTISEGLLIFSLLRSLLFSSLTELDRRSHKMLCKAVIVWLELHAPPQHPPQRYQRYHDHSTVP
jgi:hypothetical protein